MSDSTKPSKPAKPSPNFPLYAHTSGQWAKRIKGRLCYFGSWRHDPTGQAALEQYEREAQYLRRGETPPDADVSGSGCTVRELVNSFMDAKQAAVDAGDLAPRTLADYWATAKLLADHFGRNRKIADLRPVDFRRFRAALAKRYNTTSMKSQINKFHVIFNHGLEARLFTEKPDFGGEFRRPSAKAQRRVRNQAGPKLFTNEEIRRMMEAADPQMKAMIFLGLNCAFGNSDIAALPQSALDLENTWVTFPRTKTEIPRRIPLWPETIAALREAMPKRPKPENPADDKLCFLTSKGKPWVRIRPRYDDQGGGLPGTPLDAVSGEFAKLLKKLNINGRRGLGFYTLRHVFETVSGEAKDQIATDAIMGHVDVSMGGNYRHGVSDDRLRAVVAVVREWLFAETEGGAE